jgi:leader peptidase (prepilin peptidase) / N-methyltransferase
MAVETLPLVAALLVSPFVGSFLGTLALRLPEGQSVVFGRSECGECRTRLAPLELVPLISWAAQRGRCVHCGVRVSIFYPVIELAALAVALWAATTTDGSVFLISCLLGWLLLALAAMDVQTLRLSDTLIAILAVGGVAATAYLAPSALWSHALAGALGVLVLIAVSMAYRVLRGREGLGFGDVKLFGAAGLWLGLEGLVSVMLIASFSAIAAALIFRLSGKSLSAQTHIPFGPFLALGLWSVWLYGPLVLQGWR